MEPTPEQLAADIKQARREGVSLSLDREIRDGLRVTAIHWRPGDPNKLAEVIVQHCTHELELDLDGHKFRITPGGDSRHE